ncbi:MAG: diacylglycerol kinase family lipid kinase [Actinobacteria bacterium]|nr:diacylglycerol kinase family lipid kinase [Actinomycetota bacterium]
METESAHHSLPDCPLPAVVVNPIHVDDLAQLHAQIARVCAELGWAPPLWLQTTVEDPGGAQARAALAAGADVVLACGGDGTVHHVAHVLAGSGTPLGLLPTGSANLLARNLAIALNDTAKATRIALSGKNRAVDVGRVTIDDRAEEQVFLVMAGMGFDAAIMAGAPHELKARLGSLAYFVSGVRALKGPRVRITLAVDGPPVLRRRVRTVVVGNCGKLLAGLVLMPAARVDDGLLDVVTIGPRGIFGWLAVTVRVLTRRRRGHRIVQHWQGPRGIFGWLAVTVRVLTRRRRGHRIVQHWQGRTVIITAEPPQQAQLDGDPVGEVRVLRMRVDRGALLVRV